MSFGIISAINYLEGKIKDGEFSAPGLIGYLSHENDIWVDSLDPIWVDIDLIKNYKTVYDFKRELWEIMKTKFEFNGDYLSPSFIKQISLDNLKEFTSQHNLFSALLDYTKEKVRQLLWDIDNDVLEQVLNKIKKQMEKDNE